MEARTIEEVIVKLQAIINDALATKNRAGYFAALYHKVTIRVQEGILSGEFQDIKRMELLDVTFANRYLRAWQQWTSNQKPSLCWQRAFERLNSPSTLVLQHLLLGMNAHINLDLGIAAVTVSEITGKPLEDLHADYNAINTILAALSYEVINGVDQVSPLISLAGLHAGNNSMLIQFALSNARDGAWCFAEDLATRTGSFYQLLVEKRDRDIAQLADGIIHQHGFLRITLWVIHLFEWRNPFKIIGVLHSYRKNYVTIAARDPMS